MGPAAKHLNPWCPKKRSVVPQFFSYSSLDSNGIVEKEIWIVESCLNLLGTSPPIFRKMGEQPGTQFYHMDFKSLWTLAAAVSGAFSTVMWISYGLSTVLQVSILGTSHSGLLSDMRLVLEANSKLNPKVADAIDSVLQGVFCVVSIGEILEIVFGWCNSRLFVKFLNGWAHMDNGAISTSMSYHRGLEQSATKSKSGRKSSWSRLLLLLYVAGPTVAGIVFRVVQEALAGHSILEILKYCYFVLRFITVGLLTDIKQMIVYRIITDAFSQVHREVTETMERETLTAYTVNQWRKSIEKVRRQCKLASSYQQPSQLLFICRCTAQLTLFSFIIINTPREDTFSQMFSILWFAYCTMQILRLNAKMYMAKKISAMESKIAESLAKVNAYSVDQPTFSEVKFTFDLINQRPCEIVYGGFIKMETRLLAGMLGQVVTYLIVMMQYVQSK